MNLLELMLKEEVEWPVGVVSAVQDYDRELKFGSSDVPLMGGSGKAWIEGGFTKGVALKALADDWQTRIITREEYKAAGEIIANDAFEPFVSAEDAQERKAGHAATAKQAVPSGQGNPILGMVLADLTNRALEGKEKYGEPLKAHNGRNALWDAYQEALDLAMYLRQAIEEQAE